jgi:hypothetical protein
MIKKIIAITLNKLIVRFVISQSILMFLMRFRKNKSPHVRAFFYINYGLAGAGITA